MGIAALATILFLALWRARVRVTALAHCRNFCFAQNAKSGHGFISESGNSGSFATGVFCFRARGFFSLGALAVRGLATLARVALAKGEINFSQAQKLKPSSE